jgi:hypothetical protein
MSLRLILHLTVFVYSLAKGGSSNANHLAVRIISDIEEWPEMGTDTAHS